MEGRDKRKKESKEKGKGREKKIREAKGMEEKRK